MNDEGLRKMIYVTYAVVGVMVLVVVGTLFSLGILLAKAL